MSWWSEETDNKYELLPDGDYIAVLDDAQLDATVTPRKLKVTYVVKHEKYGNRKLWQNFTMSEKSAKFLSWQMGLLGVQSDAKAATSEDEYYKMVIDGVFALVKEELPLILKVTHKEYNGKDYNNIIIKDLYQGALPIRNEALKQDFNPTSEFNTDEDIPF